MRHLELIPTLACVETAEHSRSIQIAIAVKRDDELKEGQITVTVGATRYGNEPWPAPSHLPFSSVKLTLKEWPFYAHAVELAFEEYAARFGRQS
jgi:hypothetical protein